MTAEVAWLVSMREVPTEALTSRIGGKAGALVKLFEAGFEVPPWLVVLPSAMDDDFNCRPDARAALLAAVDELFEGGCTVAVRSSASDEDGSSHSFAGQLDSFLFVTRDRLLDRVSRVWRSGFSERVLAYRRERGLSSQPPVPAVLVQRMIDAQAAGVAFSADPVSGRRAMAVVSAVYGLGTALVSGAADADTWRVDRGGAIVERSIVKKTFEHRRDDADPEGVSAQAVESSRAEAPSLVDADVSRIAALARRAEQFFGRPQDIEWAVAGGAVYLLQSRPITVLTPLADPDGARQIWDNSNIAESYGGITMPLTFSFARRAYEEVYRQFCRVMAVPEDVIEDRADVFRNMLGLIQGRVYYNLLNWYRVLALLPGFRTNRRFMETMMGVRESLPEEVVAELSASTVTRTRDVLRLVRSVCGLLLAWRRIDREIVRFQALLDDTLERERPDLRTARPDELVNYYRRLESRLLPHWRAPLINDFFAMIFFGALSKISRNWCGDTSGTLQNDLLCGQGGMISAEPARRVVEMAAAAAGDEALGHALSAGTVREIQLALATRPRFAGLYQSYLEKFGERCIEELKLESLTLIDNPLLLARSVAALAAAPRAASPEPNRNPAELAGDRVATALRHSPLRRAAFAFVLRHARERVRHRENLRFERTRVFGRVRTIFSEFGRRLWAMDLLEDPRDVFYLEVNEVLGMVEGTSTCTDLRGIVAMRRQVYDGYGREGSPADRFETRGILSQGNRFEGPAPASSDGGDLVLTGLGCCPGVVRGRARVVLNPKDAQVRRGEILIAERTDPGWIMLFPLADGLVVERGSLLSHSAIVARELQLPTVVGVAGAVSRLRTGDMIELDGAAGIVRRLRAEQADV